MTSNITAQQARTMQRGTLLTHHRKHHSGQAISLTAPITPDALPPDNLLPLNVLGNGLRIHIPEWGRVLEDDTLQVKWNDVVVDTFIVVDSGMTFPYEYTLPNSQLAIDGTYSLSYDVKASSGAENSSDKTLVIIDRQPPNNGNAPGALIFPDVVMSEGLTAEYLAENNDQVIATVPSYSGMSAGQVVHPTFAGEVLDTVTITQNDVDNGSVPVVITGTTVRKVGEGFKVAYYFLTSRAGFDGPLSLPRNVEVLLTPIPTGLSAPRVPLAEDGLIDLDDASAGVIIAIDQYDNVNSGDLVFAQWDGQPLNQETVEEGFPLYVPVPREIIINRGSGDKIVSYYVMRGTHQYKAPELMVPVNVDSVGPEDPDPSTPENENLDPPKVFGQSNLENELAPEDRLADATAEVPFYKEAQVDEIIKLYWGYAPEAVLVKDYTILQQDIDAEKFPDFTVPQFIVENTPNTATWPVYYTLSRPESTWPPENPVLSPVQNVNVHMVGPGGIDGLAAAEFPDASANGWLLTAQVENGANVIVQAYENMAVGDTVTINWVAFSTTNAASGTQIADTDYSDSKTISDSELLNGVSFVIPYDSSIEPIAGAVSTAQGAGVVRYTVNQDGNNYNSPDASVRIDLGNP